MRLGYREVEYGKVVCNVINRTKAGASYGEVFAKSLRVLHHVNPNFLFYFPKKVLLNI